MSREYRHIKEYEKEILEQKEEGATLRAIGEKYGFTYEQVHNFISRYNANRRKLAAGLAIKKKGRPPKGIMPSAKNQKYQSLNISSHVRKRR